MFAIDSIPAVFSVSESPFIVYASNLFAILGLRALYLVLESSLAGLRYLRHGLAAVLCFGGAKLLVAPWLQITPGQSLLVIAGLLAVAIVASLISARANETPPHGNESS